MPKYETKLKIGRKREDVDAGTASDNQVSVLFRHDEEGRDRHVSFSVESDDMTADDVEALLLLLGARGLFTKADTRTWVSQPQASEARFGATRTWQGADVEALAARVSSYLPGAGGGASAGPVEAQADVMARLRDAERRVADMERALDALKKALSGADAAPPA